MKFLFSIGLSLLLSSNFFAQKNEKLSSKDAAIVEHFKNDYKKKNYKKFAGKILVKDNLVQFDDKTVYYDKSDKITSNILKEGLIYPQLLTDFQMQKFLDETTDKTQKRFLKLQKDPKASFDVNNIKLSNVSELTFFNSDFRVKRFKISLKDMRLNSTKVYFFELMNSKASKDISLEEFIKGSRLTYIDTTE
ncbi:hypothetical protein BA768_11750 [Chryseobacterium sp. CBo1]|uniref:hypothetical protein n=1 Tax=Chryseobacterium sp. CBo1 TaxID=1869230 RepID=UPI000810DCCB|nr:hypothetical protein [Chryseobacterium sp. CBo1]OCK52526.1 hypothetical protein BA768_11750 [Chryseobacterium sp. CBo1]